MAPRNRIITGKEPLKHSDRVMASVPAIAVRRVGAIDDTVLSVGSPATRRVETVAATTPTAVAGNDHFVYDFPFDLG